MKLRNKNTGSLATSSEFNIHSAWEIIVCYDEGDMDSDFPSNWDVQLSTGEWVDLNSAFASHQVIPNNMNTHFKESANEKEKEQGWY